MEVLITSSSCYVWEGVLCVFCLIMSVCVLLEHRQQHSTYPQNSNHRMLSAHLISKHDRFGAVAPLDQPRVGLRHPLAAGALAVAPADDVAAAAQHDARVAAVVCVTDVLLPLEGGLAG